MRFSVFIQAARPKTLTAALVPVLVGTALAHSAAGSGQTFRLSLSVFAALSALLIQIATNLVNDAIDFRKGADTEKRLGPQRVTQSGLLSYGQVMGAAGICLVLATLAGIPLVLAGGWMIVAIGLVSLFFAYGYTGGPFPLAYLGLGDLFVLIFFGILAVGGVYFLQTGGWGLKAMIAGVQIGLLATVLIAVNNLRDREGDGQVGKKTLAVRLGLKGSRVEILMLCFMPFLLNGFWYSSGSRAAALLPLLALPLAIRLVGEIFRTEPGPAYNGFLARAAQLHLLFGTLWSVGVLTPW